MGTKMNFQTMDSLSPVSLVIEEAGEAINDKTRNILNSPISDLLIATGSFGVGVVVDMAVISLIAGKHIAKLSMPGILHVLKIIGSGSAKRGMMLLALPATLLSVAGNIVAKQINKKKLQQTKRHLLDQATVKLAGIMQAQDEENDAVRVRADELNRLNILLTDFIKKLQEDLAGDPMLEADDV